MNLTLKSSIGLENLPEAKEIRINVFINEQGFKSEFDEIDDFAYHIVYLDDGKPICTGRCYKDKEDENNYHIGRVAVIKQYRNRHLGSLIMKTLEDYIRQIGGKSVQLSAQVTAMKFYNNCGYNEEGPEYLDEFCPHVKMIKIIKP